MLEVAGSRKKIQRIQRGMLYCFSGCEDSQTSADTVDRFQAGGAMTQSFIKAFEKNPMPTFPEFLRNIHSSLKKRGFSQRPQLTSSQAFDANSRVFSVVDGIEPNRNRKIGRIKRRHIRPGRGDSSSGGGMNTMLLGAAGILGLGAMFDW